MEERLKFSIIVGTYNQAGYLPALIASLDAQSFKNFEVHFCDDGSTDGTRDLLDDNQAIISKYYYHRQNHKGMRLAKNLNQGIKAAQGEYIVLVMGDSMLEDDYLERLNDYVSENRIVCGIRIQVDKTAEDRLEGVDMDWRIKKNLIPQFPSVIMNNPWNCLTGNGLTIPRRAFLETGLLDESFEGYGGEDTEIVARLYHKGYICYSVPDLRLYHHWHKSNNSIKETDNLVNEKIISHAS